MGDGFRIGSARRRQRIARQQIYAAERFTPEHDVEDSFRADVSRDAVASPIAGTKSVSSVGKAPYIAIAEAQMSVAVVIHFGYEAEIVGCAFE